MGLIAFLVLLGAFFLVAELVFLPGYISALPVLALSEVLLPLLWLWLFRCWLR